MPQARKALLNAPELLIVAVQNGVIYLQINERCFIN
jgi:hypothetical protein